MLRMASLLLGLAVGAHGAVDGSHVRFSLQGISPDYDLDFSDALQDPDGSWDYGFRLGLDFLGTYDRFVGVDLVMGAGLSLSWAEQGDEDVQLRPSVGSIPGLEMDTRLLGGGARYYVGITGGGPSFGFEAIPYLGITLQELRWELDSPTFAETYADIDWVWDTGLLLNLTTRFGDHWILGLSGSLFYRGGAFEYDLVLGEVEVQYQQFGFEYGVLAGVRF